MIYLLDADTLIRAANTYYPLERFPPFWDWLKYHGQEGNIKIPLEQYEEIVAGRDDLVDWLKEDEVKNALLLDEEVDPEKVATVTTDGYAADLDDAELAIVGRDPFLIAYAVGEDRCVVSFETSATSKQRQNRKVPDVCTDFDVECITLFELIKRLDFSTDWEPPEEE